MQTAPRFDIDMDALWHDPYPQLARLRAEAPVAFVPQLDGIVFTRRDDIDIWEKRIDIFSSEQPGGLMTRLMGQNMMRHDGDAHQSQRRAMQPAVRLERDGELPQSSDVLRPRSGRRLAFNAWH